jgi:hypothetical protein
MPPYTRGISDDRDSLTEDDVKCGFIEVLLELVVLSVCAFIGTAENATIDNAKTLRRKPTLLAFLMLAVRIL